MSHANSRHSRRLSPHQPLVFDTRMLGPGDDRAVTRTAPAPAGLGVAMVNVPEGAELALDVLLEGVAEGVLVTATVRAPLVAECARCLELFTSSTEVRFTELFAREAGEDEADGYVLSGDFLDLESALRDALVLELPLAPLCSPDCPGLCPECGVRLADAEPGHGHADPGAGHTDGAPGGGIPDADGEPGGGFPGAAEKPADHRKER